ncbi:MAG: hypothetical protein IKF96_01990 [Eggerthellaceae bacterium]|nr:hypothetical protein [Eggerthellaceae bacterium]
MDIVISHMSALRYWRRFRGNPAELHPVRRPVPMPSSPFPDRALWAELEGAGFPLSRRQPVDLLFAGDAVRTRALGTRTHSTVRPLPVNALIRLTDRVVIASPELAFVQAAEQYGFAQLALAGCELCGTYRVLDDAGKLLERPEERHALTSAARIRSLIRGLGLGDETAAARAARYVLDGAASPMEAKVALLLSLPGRLGGFGLPVPVLNAPLALSREAFAVYPHNPCRLDLYWPDARFDVEYDGGASHEGERAHAKDVARAAALELMSVDVLVLTKAQVYDADVFETMARIVARKLGRRLRIRAKDFAEKHAALRAGLRL